MSAVYTKDIVCLANSRRPPSGRCVAGLEQATGLWVRPVSGRPGLEISEEERRYRDGSQVAVLDVVRIGFKQPQPHNHQTENHLIDDDTYWEKIGHCSFENLLRLVQTPASLWVDGISSYHGLNDQIPQASAAGIVGSLVLVRPDPMHLSVVSESTHTGSMRRRVRARFVVGSTNYCLSVTHPEVEQQYLRHPDATYNITGAVACVSLSDFFKGNAYKLVATLIFPC